MRPERTYLAVFNPAVNLINLTESHTRVVFFFLFVIPHSVLAFILLGAKMTIDFLQMQNPDWTKSAAFVKRRVGCNFISNQDRNCDSDRLWSTCKNAPNPGKKQESIHLPAMILTQTSRRSLKNLSEPSEPSHPTPLCVCVCVRLLDKATPPNKSQRIPVQLQRATLLFALNSTLQHPLHHLTGIQA